MSRKPNLPPDEIGRSFNGPDGERFPPVLSPELLARLLGRSRRTVYVWIAKGRLDGAFRRRGKHTLIWRDKALDLLLNGKEWSS